MLRPIRAEWLYCNNKCFSCASPRNATRAAHGRWLAAKLSVAATVAVVLSSASPAWAGRAAASATSPGDWDDDDATSAGAAATLNSKTFAGVNSVGASQLTTTFATPNVPGAAVCVLCTFGVGLVRATRFGPDTWSGTVAKAGLTSYAGLATTYSVGGAFQAQANARLSFLRPNTLIAQASTANGVAKNVRAGAVASDPVPTPVGTYPYAAIIGGPDAYSVDTNGDLVSEPTGLEVDQPGELATIEFSADDSNDPTYLTTVSDAIWDFSITLTDTSSGPVLSAAFTDDPTRISISGGPTSPGQDQTYANLLLSNLLADTSDVLADDERSLRRDTRHQRSRHAVHRHLHCRAYEPRRGRLLVSRRD